MDSEMETTCLTLIAASGTARSQAFEALKAAKEHNMDEARRLLDASAEAALEAHHTQTKLLSEEAAGKYAEFSVLLVHAQDHLMCSMLAQELIKELVDIYELIDNGDVQASK